MSLLSGLTAVPGWPSGGEAAATAEAKLHHTRPERRSGKQRPRGRNCWAMVPSSGEDQRMLCRSSRPRHALRTEPRRQRRGYPTIPHVPVLPSNYPRPARAHTTPAALRGKFTVGSNERESWAGNERGRAWTSGDGEREAGPAVWLWRLRGRSEAAGRWRLPARSLAD